MFIKVGYTYGTTPWKINKLLKELEKEPLLSLDIETAGLYSKEERKQAEKLLTGKLSPRQRTEYSVVASNSGLSHPSLIKTTHFIFGMRNDYSVILVTEDRGSELLVWNWVKAYEGHLVIHNTLFDLKVMYHRVKTLPKRYTDTALLAKCLINNADNYKSLIGLKELVGSYYKPDWALFESYEPENLLDPKFLEYAATDGAGTVLLWQQLQEYLKGTE